MHEGPLFKCEHDYYITDSLLDYLKSYLKDRRHKIRIGDTLSNPMTVNTGCTQDFMLGPLLAAHF